MSSITDMELHKRDLEKDLEMEAKLHRLFLNQDFQDVIQKEFCEKEVLAYLAIHTDVNLSAEARDEGLEFAKAGVVLKRWLQLQGQILERKKDDLERTKETLEWARQEGN